MEITAEQHERRSAILVGMSDKDRAGRMSYLGASDANIIMGGDAEKLYRLWQEKTGAIEPEDLSDVLPVQMGTYTEALNLHWFTRKTGKAVTGHREIVKHPTIDFIRATLDGKTEHPENSELAVVDAKHVNAFNFDPAATLAKYSPQLAIQMACAGPTYRWGLLSIFSGTTTWEWAGLERDALYEAQAIEAMKHFWRSVQLKTPPCTPPSLQPVVPMDQMRKVDMRFSNAWCNFEDDYLMHEEAAGKFNKAKDEMKKLVEADIGEATGNKLRIKRGADRSLRFSKVKAAK